MPDLTHVSEIESVAVLRLNPDWSIAAANTRAKILLNLSNREQVATNFLDLCEEGRNWLALLESDFSSSRRTTVTRDVRVLALGGRAFWARLGIAVMRQGDGTIIPLEVSLTDIDELLSGLTTRPEFPLLVDRLFNVLDAVLWINAEPSNTCVFITSNYNKIWGISEQLLYKDGSNWADAIHPDDRQQALEEIQARREQSETFSIEYRILRPDGSIRWIWDRGFPIFDARGNVDLYIGAAQDISERKNEEAQMARLASAQNIASITANLAHNFNNLLSIIELSADAIFDPRLKAAQKRKLDAIRSAVSRGSEITRILMAISSRQMLNPQFIDLNDAIHSLASLIEASLGPRIGVEYDLTHLHCTTNIDVTGFNQAMVNIATNCREALSDGGEFTIRTRIRDEAPVPAAIAGNERTTRQMVEICINDTGPGMTEEVLRRALDPYFSTKGGGVGSGLGLAITNGFVNQSGGWMTLSNRMGGGLCIRIYLPFVQSDRRSRGQPAAGEPTEQGRILVVEDEADFSSAVGEILEKEGYEVDQAESAARAIELLRSSRFDLVVSDIALQSDRDGLHLAQWMAANSPRTSLVLMSGFTEFASEIPRNIDFLEKPFDKGRLLNVLARVLGKRAEEPPSS